MISGTADDWLESLGADVAADGKVIGSVVGTVATDESRMPEIGRGFRLGSLGAGVAISIEDDRLKREAKLERFDFELSA